MQTGQPARNHPEMSSPLDGLQGPLDDQKPKLEVISELMQVKDRCCSGQIDEMFEFVSLAWDDWKINDRSRFSFLSIISWSPSTVLGISDFIHPRVEHWNQLATSIAVGLFTSQE